MRISVVLIFIVVLLGTRSVAQSYRIEQYLPGTDKVKIIENGDKVIISFDQLSNEVLNRPSKVFIGGKDTGFTKIFFKARITNITDSSIQFKDRVISGRREIRLSQITGIRKITLTKQVGRTIITGLGYGLIGVGINQINGGSIWGLLGYTFAGVGLVEAGAGNHFSKAYNNNWKIRVVKVANTNSN